MAIDVYIASSTVDLMALNARQLIRLERGLRQSQRSWHRNMRRDCRKASRSPVQTASCQLRETLARRDRVRTELTAMRRQFGQAALIPIPDEFEVLLPLRAPPAGPDVDTRIPLRIPLDHD